MKSVQNPSSQSELSNLSEVIGVIEEFIRRIQIRGRYPLQTGLDLIRIAFEVAQIKSILREFQKSKPIHSEGITNKQSFT